MIYWGYKGNFISIINKIEEKYDIFWAEEPARRWDYRGLKLVSKNIKENNTVNSLFKILEINLN